MDISKALPQLLVDTFNVNEEVKVVDVGSTVEEELDDLDVEEELEWDDLETDTEEDHNAIQYQSIDDDGSEDDDGVDDKDDKH